MRETGIKYSPSLCSVGQADRNLWFISVALAAVFDQTQAIPVVKPTVPTYLQHHALRLFGLRQTFRQPGRLKRDCNWFFSVTPNTSPAAACPSVAHSDDESSLLWGWEASKLGPGAASHPEKSCWGGGLVRHIAIY